MVRVNMVVASTEDVAFRAFVGCNDLAVDFAAWLSVNGWHARIEPDVNPAAQPRLKEEMDLAGSMLAEFDKWRRHEGRH